MSDTPGDNFSTPEEFPAIGKNWKLGPPTQASREFIEVQFAAQARRNLNALAAADPKEFADEKATLSRSIAAGDYKTFRLGWLSMLPTKEGSDIVIWSWLRVNHPDVTLEQALLIQEDAADALKLAVEGIQDRFFTLLAETQPKKARPQVLAILRESWTAFLASKVA